MITMQNADRALKEYYLDAVCSQLNNVSPFFAAIEKTANHIYGKEVKIAVVRGNGGYILAGAEDGDLPDPHINRYLSLTLPLKNLYGTIEISDKALRASRDSSGAFVNLVNAEMEGLISSAKNNFQRMLFGDGSARLCTILEKKSGTKYTVNTAKGYFAGMVVDIVPSSGSTITNVVINAVDVNELSVTFSQSITDTIVNASVYVHGSRNNELTGLSALFNNGTLYGYPKANEEYVRPYMQSAKNSLTEDMLTDMIDYLDEQFNSKINMIICSYKTRKKIAALIANNKCVVNSTDVRTGIGVVTVNDVPVYADKYCPEGVIYFINTDDFVLNQLCDWEWLEDESGKILKQIPGKAAYSATLVKYADLICKRPCAQGALTDV